MRLPTKQEFEAALGTWLEELAGVIVRSPLTLAQTRRALTRVNQSIPPSRKGGSEEFRDSLLWESVLDSAEAYRVLLITNDGDFAENSELAPTLAREVLDGALDLKMVRNLQDALTLLQVEAPPLDKRLVVDALVRYLHDDLAVRAQRRDFGLGGLIEPEVEWFATENPESLAVSFTLGFELAEERGPEPLDFDDVDFKPQVRNHPVVAARGECRFRQDTGSVEAVELDVISYKWTDEEGEIVESRDIFGRAAAVMGQRRLPLVVRQQVDGG
jgi:hypothetical protein